MGGDVCECIISLLDILKHIFAGSIVAFVASAAIFPVCVGRGDAGRGLDLVECIGLGLHGLPVVGCGCRESFGLVAVDKPLGGSP